MSYAICTVAAAPVRKEASHRTEMTNQLLFGETMQVLDKKEEWVKIRSLYDDYEGWVTDHLISGIAEEKARATTPYISTDLVNHVRFQGQLIHVPMGAALRDLNQKTGAFGNGYEYQGRYRNMHDPFDPGLLESTARTWINAPYLWGGKTLMGVDCSGFVQTVFKVMGIRLKRDAWQQAEQGTEIKSLEDVKTGDLAFFHNENRRVVHVGMVLDKGQIIHASGKVRIDTLDKEGIINSENGKRTHTLHAVRRYF